MGYVKTFQVLTEIVVSDPYRAKMTSAEMRQRAITYLRKQHESVLLKSHVHEKCSLRRLSMRSLPKESMQVLSQFSQRKYLSLSVAAMFLMLKLGNEVLGSSVWLLATPDGSIHRQHTII